MSNGPHQLEEFIGLLLTKDRPKHGLRELKKHVVAVD